MKRGEILDSVKRTITQDWNNRHGEPENSFPLIAAAWSEYLQSRGGWITLSASDAAEMLAIFKGVRFRVQPDNADNEHDRIGYFAIAAERERDVAPTLPPVTKNPDDHRGEARPAMPPVPGAVPKPRYTIGVRAAHVIFDYGNEIRDPEFVGEIAVFLNEPGEVVAWYVCGDQKPLHWDKLEVIANTPRVYSTELWNCIMERLSDGSLIPAAGEKITNRDLPC